MKKMMLYNVCIRIPVDVGICLKFYNKIYHYHHHRRRRRRPSFWNVKVVVCPFKSIVIDEWM
jgi:hypothetical protein